MPDLDKPFEYPPLTAAVDALRVLRLSPGELYEPLKCTLTPMTFSEKPKYVALSYTWRVPYPDMSDLSVLPNNADSVSHAPGKSWRSANTSRPGSSPPYLPDVLTGQRNSISQTATAKNLSLILNNQSFSVGHNLYLALLHLRSPVYPIFMWVDAICINQADMEERNRQVSLMSFIYTRAIKVVAWLGTKHYRGVASLFRTMSLEWKAGQTQHFPATLAGRRNMRSSSKPDQGTIVRIAESTYWRRLWIVQEACLPRLLLLVYGSDIWTYEEFQQWNFLPTHDQNLSRYDVSVFAAMQRLLETRSMRHTDMMTLENLIELFAKNNCSELRDRVYGLLGCANDVHPFVEQDAEAESLEHLISSVSTEKGELFARRQNIGSLKVDYSDSLYQIWIRVIIFIFFQAGNVNGRIQHQVDGKVQKQIAQDVLNEERRITIVRTAGIVQDALGQEIEDDFACLKHTASEQDPPVMRAVGYIAGEIVRLGPGYNSLVSSSRAQQDWNSCWMDHYDSSEDLEALRRIDDEFAAGIFQYEEKDVDRVCNLRHPLVAAWSVTMGSNRPQSLDFSSRVADYEAIWANLQADKQEPHVCLGTGYVIGLVPSAAQLGDIIVRFWNCDAAIVMRPLPPMTTDPEARAFILIGRADVAEVIDRKATTGRDPHAEQCISGATTPGFGKGSQHRGPVYVDLSFSVLQKITAHINT